MTTKQVHDLLKVGTWLIYIGLFVEAGVKLVSVFISLFINDESSHNLFNGMNVSTLYGSDKLHFIIMALLVIIVPALKAYLFFLVIRITSKLNIAEPFSDYNARLILKMSKISLFIGLTGFAASSYAGWLDSNKINFHYGGGGTEFLFLAGILFIIAQIFKRGIELQSENELTI